MNENLQDENKIVKRELRGLINSADSFRCINLRNLGLLIAAVLIFIIISVGLIFIIIFPSSEGFTTDKIGLGIFIPAEIIAVCFLIVAVLSIILFNKSYFINLADGRKVLITYRYFKKVYTLNGVSWIVYDGQAVQAAKSKTVTVFNALSAFEKRKSVSKRIDGNKTIFETYREPVTDVLSGATRSGPLDDITFVFIDGQLKRADCGFKSDSQLNRLIFKKIECDCRAVKIPDCVLTAKKPEKADTEILEQQATNKEKRRQKILIIVFCSVIGAIVLAAAIAAIIKHCSQ